MAIGPSGGMLKKLFNPAMMKKKMKSAVQYSKSGGPGIDKNPPKKSTGFGGKK